MKHSLLTGLLLSLMFACHTDKKAENQGREYLGGPFPDSIPLVFGEGIVSVKDRFDLGFTIAPDGTSMAFGVAHESDPEKTCIYLMSYAQGSWTGPNKAFLPDNVNTFFPMFSPSGKELYFAKSVDSSPTDLWVATYLKDKAVDPRPLDTIVNSTEREAGHGKSKSGWFYFTSNRDDQNQCCGDIYYMKLASDSRSQIQKSVELSSTADEESLFLSPNDDYIIVQAWKAEFGSKHDLYISYRTKQDTWTPLQRMSSLVNSTEIEQRPFVSADNKYLFFSRMGISQKNGQEVYDSDIYWVSTKSVFHPYVYNSSIETNIQYNEPFKLDLPKDLFKDVDDSKLSFRLTMENNSKIPEWMQFDSEQFTVSGVWQRKEPLRFKLIATDASGNSGEFKFQLQEKSIEQTFK